MQTFQREKDVLDPSVLDLSEAIKETKIEMKQKNDSHGKHYHGI